MIDCETRSSPHIRNLHSAPVYRKA